jgi:acetyl esterase/lipase
MEKDVTYCAVDGIALKMDIYYPRTASRPAPAVLYIHGGGWYTGDKTTGAGQHDISTLTAHGYLVAAVNYRLAPRYKFPAQIEDVKCAVRFLRANASVYGLDPGHIGAMGDSAGGHLASLLGVTGTKDIFEDSICYADQSSQVQAVVDMFGPADLKLTFERDKSPHMEHVFGTDDSKSDIIKQASPVTHISSDAPPFLIIHGENDDVVLLDQSNALYNRLKAANVPASLIIVRNCSHGFISVGDGMTPNRVEITNSVVEFFDRYLKYDFVWRAS